jgi:hypothetical protein
MIRNTKLIYEWFFRDKLVLHYPQVDKISKQLGKALSIIGGLGWIIFVLVIITQRPGYFLVSQILFYTLFVGPLLSWIGYRAIRGCVGIISLLFHRFRKP